MYFFVFSYSLLQKLHSLYEIIRYSKLDILTLEIINNNQLKITGSYDSYNNIIKTYVKIHVKKNTQKKIVISIKFMMDILSTFPNEMLSIEKKNNVLNIYSKQGIYSIPILIQKNLLSKNRFMYGNNNTSSFIRITLFSNILSKILNKTLFSVEDGYDYDNNIINGVYFKFLPNRAYFVATDNFRLVKYTIKHILKLDKNIEFIIPKKSLEIVKRILIIEKKCNVIIEYHKVNIIFRFEHHTFSCKLIREQYPDYNSFIPNYNGDIAFVINRLLLLNTIKRILLFSNKKNFFIHFQWNHNKLKIYEQNSINNHYFDSKIQCNPIFYDGKKIENIQMDFHSQFLIETLLSINEKFILFELYYSNKIGILKPFYKKKKEESIFILIMSTIIIC
ncbi:DNA polymerase III subunit beta [Blattabacterium cuenoti]|uniref:DNA polymerase III subunit beta n=1 Tax=Blattabacterium cuenoti TaxID=1653831 RepID=UPI00163CA2FF|nr:DNA polymerase III subunit beta [Blattabacterium cuenoti]